MHEIVPSKGLSLARVLGARRSFGFMAAPPEGSIAGSSTKRKDLDDDYNRRVEEANLAVDEEYDNLQREEMRKIDALKRAKLKELKIKREARRAEMLCEVKKIYDMDVEKLNSAEGSDGDVGGDCREPTEKGNQNSEEEAGGLCDDIDMTEASCREGRVMVQPKNGNKSDASTEDNGTSWEEMLTDWTSNSETPTDEAICGTIGEIKSPGNFPPASSVLSEKMTPSQGRGS
ncbi:uncharacterized protein LOC112270098 [Brachypodium distachyon]|nr:uncharacterized protein LOC112270098 [Brachypodium distachyon]|eukprot:XP_024313560.1 uncharacterized protein LOC112270098 [Brachypodium distachyon]